MVTCREGVSWLSLSAGETHPVLRIIHIMLKIVSIFRNRLLLLIHRRVANYPTSACLRVTTLGLQ